MFRRDPFGHLIFLKRILISATGWLTWTRYAKRNRMEITGTENLENLPATNVLLVSNHQTYFADVIGLLHVVCAVSNGYRNSIASPRYLFHPKINNYFVAAEETMKEGWLPRILAYTGSISIQRTWREGNKDVNRKVRMEDLSNIGTALNDGWVVNFPQGTTKPYAKGRRGIILLVKKYNPVVIPIVIDGFSRAFDKSGFRLKEKNTSLKVRIKPQLHLDPAEDADILLQQIMEAIEQSEKYYPSVIKTTAS